LLSLGCVILLELRTQAARFHADNGIGTRVVADAALEDVGAEEIFLERAGVTRQGAIDEVAQEAAQLGGITEDGTGGDRADLVLKVVPGDSVE
jgi:hypothetical protein